MNLTLEQAIHDLEANLNYMTQHKKAPPGETELLQLALDALREKAEREKPDPLTMEELEEMDNCPVYVRYGDGREGWVILVWECGVALLYGPEWDESPAGQPDPDFYNLRHNDPQGHFGLHSLGWLAYRNSPKEAEEK